MADSPSLHDRNRGKTVLKIELDKNMRLSGHPEWLADELKELFTMVNPEWAENQRKGRYNGKTPRSLMAWQQTGGVFECLRGCSGEVLRLVRERNLKYGFVDNRLSVQPDKPFRFGGTLKPFQTETWKSVSGYDFGVLEAPTGSGKTVMAIHAICERNQKTLILVHTKDLLLQWCDRLRHFVVEPGIGMIGGGKNTIADITVATVQSLSRGFEKLGTVADSFGFLVVDECHRMPSKTFSDVVRAFRSKYMLGLSATPYRRDGLTKFIHWHLGRKAHVVGEAGLVADGHILPVELVCRDTDFTSQYNAAEEYSKMLSELAEDVSRNWQIATDILSEYRSGSGVILVLSDRKSHCETLSAMLRFGYGVTSGILTGDLPSKKREEVRKSVESGCVRILFATGQLIGEGFDLPAMEILFLATPMRFSGRVIQYLGRIRRKAGQGKSPRVWDYRDRNIGVLMNSSSKRRAVIRRMGDNV